MSHNFIKCSCGEIIWHGDSMPSRTIENGCDRCKAKAAQQVSRVEDVEIQEIREQVTPT